MTAGVSRLASPGVVSRRTAGLAALVAAGGFAGAGARHALAGLLPGRPGTLAANAVASVLLGLLLYRAAFTGRLGARTRAAVASGFLSSLSTYSTFALQSVRAPELLLVTLGAHYALGFAGVLAGRAVARRLA